MFEVSIVVSIKMAQQKNQIIKLFKTPIFAHLFTSVKALGICTDFISHVAWNVWPKDDECEDDEKENDAGDT